MKPFYGNAVIVLVAVILTKLAPEHAAYFATLAAAVVAVTSTPQQATAKAITKK